MSIEQQHQHIRQALAAIGYHVRSQHGFALSIVLTVTKHDAIEATLAPQFRVSAHADYQKYIVAA